MQLLLNLNVLTAALSLLMVYPASLSNAGISTRLNTYGVSATPVVNYALDDPIDNIIDTPFLNRVHGRDADDNKKKNKKQGNEKKEKGKKQNLNAKEGKNKNKAKEEKEEKEKKEKKEKKK
jgi:hypothetical protein